MLARASTGYQWFLSGYSMEQPYISVRVISFPLTKKVFEVAISPDKEQCELRPAVGFGGDFGDGVAVILRVEAAAFLLTVIAETFYGI